MRFFRIITVTYVIIALSIPGLNAQTNDESGEKKGKQEWASSKWKKIQNLTKQKRSFKTEKATTVAGVRGSEAEDNLLKQLYYKGGTKYPSRLELKNAIDILEKDIRLDPYGEDVPENKFFIGQCYSQLGEAANAIEAYEDIISDFPDSEFAAMAKDEIAALNQ